MSKRNVVTVGLLAAATGLSVPAHAQDTNLTVGFWANYRYVQDDDRDEETVGDIADEAVIFYADGDAGDTGNWVYSAELRIGPGSFTDPLNNSSGENFNVHKAWVGWKVGDNGLLRVGKSQVPFGWKTVNFWPGDILQAGYGDQMDVGLKFSNKVGSLSYDVAYYHADDWGETSTDTVDDNRHWGSASTFRKVQTVVANVELEVIKGQTLAASVQSGGLQDLTGISADAEIDGDHTAWVIWYHGQFGNFYTKAEFIGLERELPENVVDTLNVADTIENTRIAAELGYKAGPWFFYLDASAAQPDTQGSNADDVRAIAPGFSYNYGPGWIYVEYLQQDGFVDRNGQIGEGDFDALYLSLDFYL